MKFTRQDFRKFLAAFFSVAALLYMAAITFIPVPKENINNSNIILGFLISTALSTVIGFYFGGVEESDKPLKGEGDGARTYDEAAKKMKEV